MIDVSIVAVVNRLKFLDDCLHWMRTKVPEKRQVESEGLESIVKNFMLGRYNACVGFRDYELCGYMIYESRGDTCFSKLIFCEPPMKDFYSALFDSLTEAGYKYLEFESCYDKKLWNRIGLDRKVERRYSVFRVPV